MSIAHLADTGLPFNRKERYSTGTVLPMLVCADNFAHFDRLTELVGLDQVDVDARPTSADVQFFTEYSFVESVVGEAKARFPGAPVKKGPAPGSGAGASSGLLRSSKSPSASGPSAA